MAHKTNSKEQFMFKFYFFTLSFKLTTPYKTLPRSAGGSLLVFYLIKKRFPFFETNLMFLKYYQVSSLYLESRSLNFHKLITG